MNNNPTTGSEQFIALFKEVEDIHKPIGPFFAERVAHAHYTLTTEIFDIIAHNNQKQAAKQLIVIRKALIKLNQSLGIDLIIRFDPKWRTFGNPKAIGEPDVFRLKLAKLIMYELDKLVDFIIDYKPIPRVPKRI